MPLYSAVLAQGLVHLPDTGERLLPSGGSVRIDRRPFRRRGPRV